MPSKCAQKERQLGSGGGGEQRRAWPGRATVSREDPAANAHASESTTYGWQEPLETQGPTATLTGHFGTSRSERAILAREI